MLGFCKLTQPNIYWNAKITWQKRLKLFLIPIFQTSNFHEKWNLVREIGLAEGKTFSSSYRDFRQIEDVNNRDSTVLKFFFFLP